MPRTNAADSVERQALEQILETMPHFYTEGEGDRPKRLPEVLRPYAGVLSVIFRLAHDALETQPEPAEKTPPRKLSVDQLVGVLNDMMGEVARGASFDGSLEYAATTEPEVFDVRGAYRTGNDMGQGGMVLI